MALPLDTAVKTIGKQVAKHVGGEVAEGVTKTAWKGVGKSTKKVTKATPNWSNNDLLTRFKKNSIKHKEAKQFINDLEPYDVDLLTEFSLIEPKAFQAFGDKVELAARDFNPREDHWQDVNGLLIGLERQVQDIRNRQWRQNYPDELDFTPKDPDELERAMGVERGNRIGAAERTGKSGTHVSTRTTAGTADPGPKSYGSTQRSAPYQEPEIEGPLGAIEGMPKREQHHELIKAYFEPFITRARQLGSELDVVNLAYMADHYGFGLGDYLAAMKMMDRIPHSVGHKELITKEIQPATVFKDWTLSGEQERILKIDNIADLTREFRNAIEQVGEPMRKEMNQWQDAWERIPPEDRLKLIQLRIARKQAGAPKSPAYKEADETYQAFKQELVSRMEGFKTNIEDFEEVTLDEKLRQMGG